MPSDYLCITLQLSNNKKGIDNMKVQYEQSAIIASLEDYTSYLVDADDNSSNPDYDALILSDIIEKLSLIKTKLENK